MENSANIWNTRNIDDSKLEGKVLTVLSKLDVIIDPANVEAMSQA